MKKVLELIAFTMLEKRISLRDLSKITGINEANLSKYVNGKKPIGFKTANIIGAALNLNPIDLVEFSPEERKTIQEVKKRAAKFAGK